MVSGRGRTARSADRRSTDPASSTRLIRLTTDRLDSRSELEPRLAGGVGQGLDPAMILVASAVEANLVNTGLLGPLGDDPADDRGGGLVAAVGVVAPRTSGSSVLAEARVVPVVVVDDLGVDVLRAPEDGQPGPLGGPVEPLADVPLAAEPADVRRVCAGSPDGPSRSRGGFRGGRSRPDAQPRRWVMMSITRRVASAGLLGAERLAGLAADDLALVADALALVRLGGRTLRTTAANWPTACLSAPADRDVGRVGDDHAHARRGLQDDLVGEADLEGDGVRLLELGLVADADDLQLLGVAGR